jgi:hypothetical protein
MCSRNKLVHKEKEKIKKETREKEMNKQISIPKNKRAKNRI